MRNLAQYMFFKSCAEQNRILEFFKLAGQLYKPFLDDIEQQKKNKGVSKNDQKIFVKIKLN